ncbi:ABC transporter ATP-binding protein [Dyella sp.]|uniref:ABC transporter ATP-binding protein n=1 Tax=Dyella sp. TaxID=1869338 RepID=UPI002ED5A05E
MNHIVHPVARLAGAIKRYGNLTALEGLDLELRPGELLALLGPNGAGKTTAIGLLLGLIRADGGRVELFGEDPQRISARRRIGVMLQSAVLQGTLRVRELVDLTAAYYPAPLATDHILQLAGIVDLAKRPYADLSGGQQRRVQFAMAVVGQPELVFLDEPTVGMDLDSRQSLWAAVRQLVAQGTSVVLTTHYLEEAEALADRVCVMVRGRMISEGSVDALRAKVLHTRVRCMTSVTSAQLGEWGIDIDEVKEEHGRLSITTVQAENVVRRLLAADPDVRELEVHRAGLSEAFTELTRDQSRISDVPMEEVA